VGGGGKFSTTAGSGAHAASGPSVRLCLLPARPGPTSLSEKPAAAASTSVNTSLLIIPGVHLEFLPGAHDTLYKTV
jgi:hypothetical protein